MSTELPRARQEHFDLLLETGVENYEQLRDADIQELRGALVSARDHYNPEIAVPDEETIKEWTAQAYAFSGELPGKEDTPFRRRKRLRKYPAKQNDDEPSSDEDEAVPSDL